MARQANKLFMRLPISGHRSFGRRRRAQATSFRRFFAREVWPHIRFHRSPARELPFIVTRSQGEADWSDLELGTTAGSAESYDPLYLDDPAVKSGKHRVVMVLPGVVGSVMGKLLANKRPPFPVPCLGQCCLLFACAALKRLRPRERPQA